MLAVIDYGAGNLPSVLHALKHLGAQDVHLIREPDGLRNPGGIILPGVGAFGAGMQELHRKKLVDPLIEAIQQGIPYLGICLGLQFLFEESNEMGRHSGLGVLKGRVTRFEPNPLFKVPHMGWNQLRYQRESSLFNRVVEDSYAYFVHSYYCAPDNPQDTVVTADYGITFTAAVQRGNIFGVQFHPEKSQQVGLQILSNFLSMVAGDEGTS